MHNFCFNRTELIPIDESECILRERAKHRDVWLPNVRVDVRVYKSKDSNRNYFFFWHTEFPAVKTILLH